MSIVPATEVRTGVFYQIHPDHRNNSPQKSQWTIGVQSETTCFEEAFDKVWIIDNIGWGLYSANGRVTYLGLSTNRSIQLFIAKFIDGSKTNRWHGYPADYQNKNKDIPAEEICRKWLAEKVLAGPKIRKILKRQPCNL